MQRADITRYNFLIYLMICGMGFMGLVFAMTCHLGDIYFDAINESLPYTLWATSALATHKAVLLSGYLTGLVGLFVYVLMAVMVNYQFNARLSDAVKLKMGSPLFLTFILASNVLLMLAFWFISAIKLLIGFILLWLVLLIFPIWLYQTAISILNNKITSSSGSIVYFRILMAAGCIAFILAFSPFLKLGSLQVSNDYLWVPEKTYIENEVIDNNQYIMSHGIGGLYRDGLIQSSADLNLKLYRYIPVVYSSNLQKYLVLNKIQFDYLPSLNALFIKKDRLTGDDKQNLCSFASDKECQQINDFNGVLDASGVNNDITHEFIQKNKYEIVGQILAGHYFHHQYAMLGPINELALGKDPAQIIYLYGLGNVHLLSFVFNHVWHQLTFESFTFTLYTFYLLYFALFVGCCAAIFRDIRYVSIITVSVVGLFFLIGFELIRIAPGFNPLRHFSDLLLLMSFYGYLYARRFNVLYLAAALSVGILAVYLSKEFGLMMFVALLGASLLHIILCSKRYVNLLILGAGLGVLFFVLHSQSAAMTPNPMSLYSILGVSVAPSRRTTDLILLMSVFACYVSLLTLFFYRGAKHKPLYLCLFLFFYCQCLWVYFAWYTEPGHLYSTSPIWVLFFLLMYRELSPLVLKDFYRQQFLVVLGGGVASLLLVMGSVSYFSQLYNYTQIFKSHVIYQWDFPGAHFQSTMDPAVFKESVALMQTYSHDNAIYVISKYDNLLPFLAGKYSAMPYLELSTSLVTDTEVDTAAAAILTARPKYLFVDSDINSNNVGDILDPMSLLKKDLDRYLLSGGRVSVLNESKRVFKKVASHYRLVKSGYLVSVYEYH